MMSKNRIPLAHEIRPARSTSRRPRIVRILVVIVLVLPIVVEGAVLSYARWSEVMGRSTEVYTPITTAVTEGLQNARESLWDPIGTSLERSVRDPMIALPVAFVFLVLAMVMLRR